jgi:ribosomal-protein-serine acetyltransferase
MIGVMDAAGSPAEELTSDGVVLRRWRAADAGLAYRLVSESAVYLRPWLPWAADYTPETARAFTRACEQDWAAGAAFSYLIRHAGAPAGSAGLMTRRGPGVLELGYARVGTEPGRFGRAPGECGTAAVWRIMRPAG